MLRLLFPDEILDVPESLVHLLQGALVTRHVERSAPGVLPGFLEEIELETHVGDLAGIDNAGDLDTQDGDLVEQFARRDGYEEVFHVRHRNNSSSLPVTWSTPMRSITPRCSIFSVQGSFSGVRPR